MEFGAYLAISSEWQPAYAILGVAVLGLELEEGAVPLADAGIEKHIELVDFDAEELGEEEVPAFVQEHKE